LFMCCWANTPVAGTSQISKLESDLKKARTNIEAEPGLDLVYERRAEECINSGKYSEAVDNCSKAIALNNEDLRAYRLRAIAYSHLGEKDKAADDQGRLVALQAQISIRNSKNEIAKYTEQIKTNPNNSKAYADRAAAYMSLNEYRLALADSAKAIRLDPKNKYPFFTRMAAYAAQHEKGKADADRKQFDILDRADKIRLANSAVVDYSKLLEANPNDTNALINRARAFFELGKYFDCKTDCDRLLRLGANKVEAEQMRSCCQQEILRKSGKLGKGHAAKGLKKRGMHRTRP
jgi:tetratricopeptide (TPR) repeat protein